MHIPHGSDWPSIREAGMNAAKREASSSDAAIDFHRIICTIEEPWSGGKWASQMGKKPVSFGHPKTIA
jgi:hypothetical protein